jgi:hypothetical protein
MKGESKVRTPRIIEGNCSMCFFLLVILYHIERDLSRGLSNIFGKIFVNKKFTICSQIIFELCKLHKTRLASAASEPSKHHRGD